MLNDETHYRILKAIEDNPAVSQRDLAAHLGISLGKANYCLQELVKMGWIKACKFKASPDRRVYTYLLTPSGVKEKSKVTLQFLKRKMNEYEEIKQEITRLKAEVQQADTVPKKF